ncbi:MAG TPA: hypothetical protein VHK69_05505 [Chitinophagaceae bacterium]|jgi:hypothetical protein|nr:hypothetical protein [Chitinophagaceae bacterium]
MSKFFLWIIGCLAMASGAAQAVKVSAAADRAAILIGEPLQLQLQATMPGGQPVEWFATDSFPHFEVLQRGAVDTVRDGTTLTLRQTLTLTSWDSGAWQLPSFYLPQSNRTPPIRVTVNYTDADPGQPYHDIKDIVDVPPAPRETWYWYVIGAILLLLLVLLLMPRRKKAVPKPAPVVTEDSYRVALKRLETLQQGGLATTDPKAYFTELTAIFREYLHRRKGIWSYSQTTDDLAVQVQHLSLERTRHTALVQALRLSDVVKFARYQPLPEESGEALTIIKQSIQTIEEKG